MHKTIRLNALENDFEKVVYKTDEFLRNKIVDAIAEWNNNKIVKPKTGNLWKAKKCWRNNNSTGKKRRKIKQIKTGITKMERYKYLSY